MIDISTRRVCPVSTAACGRVGGLPELWCAAWFGWGGVPTRRVAALAATHGASSYGVGLSSPEAPTTELCADGSSFRKVTQGGEFARHGPAEPEVGLLEFREVPVEAGQRLEVVEQRSAQLIAQLLVPIEVA